LKKQNFNQKELVSFIKKIINKLFQLIGRGGEKKQRIILINQKFKYLGNITD
jgi:hypothetical protein